MMNSDTHDVDVNEFTRSSFTDTPESGVNSSFEVDALTMAETRDIVPFDASDTVFVVSQNARPADGKVVRFMALSACVPNAYALVWNAVVFAFC